MPTSTITSKGQVTIPKEVRDLLRLAPGDRVEFTIDGRGTVRVRPVTRSAKGLYGFLRWRGPSPGAEEMDQSLQNGRSDDDARIRRGR